MDKKFEKLISELIELEIKSARKNKIDDSFQSALKLVYNNDYEGLKQFIDAKRKEIANT